MFLHDGVLLIQRVHFFAEVFELEVLLVLGLFGFVGQRQFALALLPIEGLLLELDQLLLLGLLLLLQLVRIHFGQAVAAVGFEQGEAGLFQLVLLLVALAADVVVLLLQLGCGFA